MEERERRGELESVEERRRRERRRLIEHLNQSEERLRQLETRRRDPGRPSETEIEQGIEQERERNLSRRGFGQIL